MTDKKGKCSTNNPILLHTTLLILASCLPFMPGVSDEFVFDDLPAVKNNKDMTEADPFRILQHDFWGENITSKHSHKSYRPVTSLTYWAQFRLTGTEAGAGGFKAVNILLHCLNTLLLHRLLSPGHRRLVVTTSSPSPALLTSLMFACHPVHVEPILSLVGRADLLYTSLFLVSSLLLLTWSPRSPLGVSAKFSVLTFLTAVSMFAKEQGILFLAFWWLMELLNTGGDKRRVFSSKFLIFCICMALNLSLLVFIRLWVNNFEKPTFQRSDNPTAFEQELSSRILNFSYIHFLNVAILLFPNWLCFDWAMGCLTKLTFFDKRIFILVAFWSIAALMAVKMLFNLRARKLEYFALCLLITPFVLSMNVFIYVGFVIAERNLYLSQAGMSLIISKGFLKLNNFLKSKHKKLLSYSLMGLVLVSFSAKSYIRGLQWRNEMDLFQSGLRICPNNAKVHYNIAKKHVDNNKTHEAVILYKESIRLEPDYEHALNNLGNLLKTRKQFEEAEKLLEKATLINPKFSAAFMNLGIVEQAQGKYENAEKSYLRALRLRPLYPDCEFNLGNLYLKTRKFEEAEKRFRTGAKHGHQLSFVNLLVFLDEQSRLGEAQSLAVEAINKFPSNPEFLFQYANILGQQAKFEESEKFYLRAISLGDKALFWANLGVLYHRWGRRQEAIEAYREALSRDGGLASARANLKTLL